MQTPEFQYNTYRPECCRIALAFARRGIRCLPLHKPILSAGVCRCSCGIANCPSIGKHPRLSYSAASVDPTTLQSWFAAAHSNLGVLTGSASGIVVLDVDPRHGGDDALRALTGKHGDLPETWRFLTGGGGEHIGADDDGRACDGWQGQIIRAGVSWGGGGGPAQPAPRAADRASVRARTRPD
jgi:hypothetical protein